MATVTGPMLTTNVLSDQLALDFSDRRSRTSTRRRTRSRS
jgi:hypothetical protein